MKECNRCHELKEESDFATGQRRCRACQAVLSKEHYKKNKPLYMKRNALTRNKKKDEVGAYKVSVGCSICGYNSHPKALAFHHVNPENKYSTIAGMIFYSSRATIWEEINKCVVVCHNCHATIDD